MAQIQKGTTYSTGDQVTAANLNALADAAILLPGAITDQTAKTVPLAADTILLHSAADTALRKSTLTQLFSNATGIPISTGISGLGTGIATALAINTGTTGAPALLGSAGAFTTLSASTYVQATGGGNDVSKLYSSGTLSTLQLGSPTEAVGGLKYERSTGAISVFNGTQASQTTIALFSSTGLGVTGALSVSGAALTLGTNSGSGTSRRVFDIEAGGYAAPGAFNTDSNGDKINFFKGGSGLSYDARIGIGTTSNLWYRSSGSTSGVGVHEFYVGSTPTLIQTISSTGLAVTGKTTSTATTVSPATSGTTQGGPLRLAASNGTALDFGAYAASPYGQWIQAVDTTNLANTYPLILNPNGGNVGIGTTSPTTKLEVVGPASVTSFTGTSALGVRITGSTSTNDYSGIDFSASTQPPRARIGAYYSGGGSYLVFGTSNSYGSGITNSALTIDYNGNVVGSSQIRAFSSPGTNGGAFDAYFNGSSYHGMDLQDTTDTSGAYYIVFRNSSAGVVGSVTRNGTSNAVLYNTSSDYRLKDITGPLTDSGAFIDALQPKVGTWKSDGSKFVGFIAHEFAEVSPSSVVGKKDDVDDKGEPLYQGMQASSPEVIANLVAELQSVRQRLAALESK